ncbi:MAG: hypothetical protein Q9190_005638 [Brigantiaea leucoxantha]
MLLAVAGRETEAVDIATKLLDVGSLVSADAALGPLVLNAALFFFRSDDEYGNHNGLCRGFLHAKSIKDVLNSGPGGMIKLLLSNLPDQQAKGAGYNMLLQMAATAGDQELVELLVERGAAVNAIGHLYGTSLQAAAEGGSTKVMQCLINAGAEVNVTRSRNRLIALQAAARTGNVNAVKLLLAVGADVDIRQRSDYDTPLRAAVDSENPAVARTLIEHGANVNFCSQFPLSPHMLHLAVKTRNNTILRMLLDGGADVNASSCSSPQSPLYQACAEGYVSGVKILLSHGADIEKERTVEFCYGETVLLETPLQVAASRGHFHIVRLLIEAGANLDRNSDRSAVSLASAKGYLEVVKELVKAGASLAGPHNVTNSLTAACRKNRRRVVKFLLEALFDTEREELTIVEAMAAICKEGNTGAIQLLSEHGIPVVAETSAEADALPRRSKRRRYASGSS